MFKLFKKDQKEKETYNVIFCDENNPATKFHEYATCETYEQADHVIRMAWRKKSTDRIGDGYKVDGGWILIEKRG